jgi:uncharacterized membrane protein
MGVSTVWPAGISARWFRRLPLLLPLLLAALVLRPGGAQALAAGEVVSRALPLHGKHLPLPAGEWIVAGTGTQDFDMPEIGAFGAIRNVVLFQRRGARVTAMIELNANAVPVTDGWGRTRACQPARHWLLLTRYRTGWETSCIFVQATRPRADEAAPEAWRAARRFAATAGLVLPDVWLTAGFRISDRQDIVDARYHFNPSLFVGGERVQAEDWTPEAVRADPVRLGAAETLSAWAIGFDALIEQGLRNRPVGPAPDMPQSAAFLTDAPGVDGKLAALEDLFRAGVLPRDEYLVQSAMAARETPLRIDRTGGLPPSVQKNISFRVFGSIVDYALAYFVTANNPVSGAITATIVVTHSIIFVLNDNYWEDYWARRTTRDASRVVDFAYVGEEL